MAEAARLDEIRHFLNSANGKNIPKLDAELNAIMERYKEVATHDEVAAELLDFMLAQEDNFGNYFECYGNILTRFGFDQLTMIEHLEDTLLLYPPYFVHVINDYIWVKLLFFNSLICNICFFFGSYKTGDGHSGS